MRIATQTFAKLQGLWNKQNRSSVASDKIRSALGCLLVTPGETRWNSTYDAVVKIHHLLSSPNTEAKFDKLCEELDIRRLLPQQKTFVQEYVEVFQLVCCGLDVLQGEKDVGLGHLLSMLAVVKGQLTDMSVCGPIVQLLLNGIENRFKLMLTNTNAQLAAVVHPKFKCDWVLDEDERSRLVNILKRSVASTASISQPADNNENPHTSATETSASPPKDFFAVLASRRQQAAAGVGCDIEEELSQRQLSRSEFTRPLSKHSKTVYHTEHWSASKCGS